MNCEKLPLAGAMLLRGAPAVDVRGSFERIVSLSFLASEGLETLYPEVSLSENEIAGTRRGMHFQRAPHDETKIVRCVRGAIYDVIIDIRRESKTFGKAYGIELKAGDHQGLYIPRGFAHGFQTLKDKSTVLYFISKPFAPDHAAGLSSDDPALAISWPAPPSRISSRDRNLPAFKDAGF